MVIISLGTGVRRGELFQLRWEKINWKSRLISVAGDTAKSGQTRHISMNREVERTVSQWWKQCGSPLEGLIFETRGRPMVEVKTAWKRLLLSARISQFRWHDLRHDFASQLAQCGVDLNAIRELLGHTDLKMTLRYAHLCPNTTATAVAQLDDLNERLNKSATSIQEQTCLP